MPQGEVMWQLGDIHEKLGNHGKAGSVGFVSRPPWLEENHGLIGICLRSVDQFDPCNESSCCILVGVWPIRRNVSIDVTMYVYISIGLYTPNHPLEHLLQCWLPKECGTYDMGHALKEKNVGRMNHTAGMIFWVSLCLHFFWCCLGSIATLLSCFFCKYSLRMFTYGIFFQFSISLVSSTLSNELFFFRSLHSQSRWSFRLGGAWMVFTFGDFTKRSANRPRQGRWVRVSSNTLRNKENCLKIWGTIARLHHK